MKCTKCQTNLADGMKFCPECGTPIPTKKRLGKKEGLFGCLSFIVIAFLIGSCFFGNNDDQSKSATINSSQPSSQTNYSKSNSPNNASPYNIGIHKHKFTTYFNATAKKLNIPLEIQGTDKSLNDNVPEITYFVTNNIGIKATINEKDGTIRNIYMLGKSDGNSISGAQIISTITILIATLHPDISSLNLGNIMKSLNITLNNPEQLVTEKKYDNIKYRFTISPIGIIFSARNISDPDNS